jgi:hypothetical protein
MFMYATDCCILSDMQCRYGANIGVVLLNKYLLSFYGFRFPVLLTLLHMAVCSMLSGVTALSGFVVVQRAQTKAQLLKVSNLARNMTYVQSAFQVVTRFTSWFRSHCEDGIYTLKIIAYRLLFFRLSSLPRSSLAMHLCDTSQFP